MSTLDHVHLHDDSISGRLKILYCYTDTDECRHPYLEAIAPWDPRSLQAHAQLGETLPDDPGELDFEPDPARRLKVDAARVIVAIGLFLLGIGAATRDQVSPLAIAAGAVIVALVVEVRR